MPNLQSAITPAVGRAAGRALAVWIGIYVLLVTLYVAWKWDSHDGMPVNSNDDALLDPSQIQRLEQLTQQMKAELVGTERIGRQVRELQEQLKANNSGASEQGSSLNDLKLFQKQQSKEQNFFEPKKFAALLSHLSEQGDTLDTDKLMPMLRSAIRDIDKNLQQQEVIDWSALRLAFEEIAKSSVSQDSTRHETVCPPNVAREEDVENRIAEIHRLMKIRWENNVEGSLPVAYPQTRSRLEMFLAKATNKLAESRIVKPEPKENESSAQEERGGCMKSQDVVPWLEAGLSAIHHRSNIRRAVQTAINESPMGSNERIILDAVLTETKSPLDEEEDIGSLNLRQLLDGPLLSDWANRWIGAGLDFLSGYNDSFDQLMDRWAMEEGSNNLGRAVVSRGLTLAGRISIPQWILQRKVKRQL